MYVHYKEPMKYFEWTSRVVFMWQLLHVSERYAAVRSPNRTGEVLNDPDTLCVMWGVMETL